MTTATIPQPLKWHGGKAYLASRIVALMPPHVHYVEPFAGGLSVLLAKNPEGVSEVANDLNGWLTNFWNVLRDPERFAEMQRFLEATPFSEALFTEAACVVNASPMPRDIEPVIAAAWFFVLCRQSMAGRMDGFAPLSRNRVRRGMNEQASAWITAIEGLPIVHKRLFPVVILNGPAVKVIQQQDGENTLHYLDPPYAPETRTSKDTYGPNEMTIDQHGELLDVAGSCKGRVMISGYDCGLYADRLKDWTRHTFDLPNNAAGGAEKRRMTEVVWCNF
jgi:DNA adenine methylase